MNSSQKKRTIWPHLASLLLLSLTFTAAYSGLEAFFQYKKSVQPGIQLTPSTLHLFIKEELKRKIQKLTAKKLPEDSKLPSIQLYAAEHDLAALDANLPSSGKTQVIAGHIKDNLGTLSSESQFRYRGGLPLHWLHEKKSFRVNLPPYTTYRGARKFNLVSPSTIETITDWVSNEISREIGLITPDYEPVRLFVNGEYNGLHFFLSQVDESLLRKFRRMPGSIYSGDSVYRPNPFGPDKDGINEVVFKNKYFIPMLWTDARLWEKDAARNADYKNDRSDIDLYIQTINERDPLKFMNVFDKYFNKEKFYAYWALDNLVGAYHHDYFHNHKLYFDPYIGKFEPIQWDIRFWSSSFAAKDPAAYPLVLQVEMNPLLAYERDKATYELMQKYPEEVIYKRLDDAHNSLRGEIAADPYRQFMGPTFGIFAINKEMPFNLEEYDTELEYLKRTYSNRQKFLLNTFEAVFAEYQLKVNSNDEIELNVSINGNGPAELQLAEHFGNSAQFFRKHNGKVEPINGNLPQRLYPGRKLKAGNASGRLNARTAVLFGPLMAAESPNHYTFIIKNGKRKLPAPNQIFLKNAITNSTITAEKVHQLSDDSETTSLHPWDISTLIEEQVYFSGEVNIERTRVFTENQHVMVAEGTTFKIAPDASLVFYGGITAEGSEQKPILFSRSNPESPWGALVVQGAAASNSKLKHIIVEGGSLTSQRLIHYPGMLNIHDLTNFTLSNCVIRDNSIGDDALHVAYSRGEVTNCHFQNTAFDAIDIDISQVTVRNNTFLNAGNDALDLMTSQIEVEGIKVEGAGDKCISAGEASEVTVKASSLTGCEIGMAVKDKSKVAITDSFFSNNRSIAISLYRKNPRYSAGGTLTGNKLTGVTKADINMDDYSTVQLDLD